MKTLNLTMLISLGLTGSFAFPCTNTEYHESIKTTYTAGIACGEGSCPMNSLKEWTYSCVGDQGSDCVPQPDMIQWERKDYICLLGTCTLVVQSEYGTGKTTMVCP